MPLVDYLFVDLSRLDSYVEQFSPERSFDRPPVWKVMLGLTGPQVGVENSAVARSPTTHEKIEKLLRHLDKQEMIAKGRISYREWSSEATEVAYGKRQFRLEECSATRVFIPPRSVEAEPFPGLGMWISLSPGGNLYLLEGLAKSDSPITSSWSSYTALQILIRESGLYEQATDHYTVRSLLQNQEEFSVDPLRVLSKADAQVGTQRQIRVLYRVRSVLREGINEPMGSLLVFGYPIFIAEAAEAST